MPIAEQLRLPISEPSPGPEPVEVHGFEWQRLGETADFGFALLSLLSLAGWEVAVTKPFSGQLDDVDDGVYSTEPAIMVVARKGSSEVRRAGVSVAEVAGVVFQEALKLDGLGGF